MNTQQRKSILYINTNKQTQTPFKMHLYKDNNNTTDNQSI